MEKEKLCNLYEIGSSKRVFQSEWKTRGVPFYRAREIAKLSEDGFVDNELFIDENLYKEYIEKYGKPQPGDVMVTGVGTLGVCYVVKPYDKFYFKDGNILWFKQKAPERILPEYLVKAFDSKEVKEYISKNSSGSTVGTFTIQNANRMEITLPPIERQKEIVNRISKLEKIIRKKQDVLKLLDELVKARFVELFGDSVYNPKGWDTYPLEECLDRIDNGRSFVCSDKPRKGNYPAVLKLSAATYGDYRPAENKALLDENQFVKGAEVHSGDLLFTRKNTPELVGMAAYVHETPEKLMMPDLIFRLVTNKRMNPVFLWQLINSKEFRPIIQSVSGGSAKSMSNISKERLGKIRVICPPRHIQDQLVPFIAQVDKSKFAVQKSLEETQLLFDSLMQEYFG